MHAVRYLCDQVCSTEVYDTKTIITSEKLINTCEGGVVWKTGRWWVNSLSLSLRARAGSSPKTRGRFSSARPLVRGVVAPLFSSVKPLLLAENTAVSRINSVGRNPQTLSCLPSYCFGPVRTFYLYPLWSCCRHSLIYCVSEYRCVASYRILSAYFP